ncbi:hypothetical protein C7999DRAFT_15783 [Corynascus novoguineensis]|uniref:Uncharacterized protein n=1 Tax=Corynascus novoguineensis TaxID=1126955 RepID=A0AAN7HNH5_9PEZI|nr:hypothetical protein C7999DRAFT_15783 [Corynascus novoguineensis]
MGSLVSKPALLHKLPSSWAVRELTAWCEARPPAATLDLASAYDELRLLDNLVNSLVSRENGKKRAEEPGTAETREKDDSSNPSSEAIVHAAAYEDRLNQLRSRTLELSRGRLRPLKITDLPPEILGIVFEEFLDAQITSLGECSGLVNWNYIVPEWDSDETNPDMAAGVRGVAISLAYWPEEYAGNLRRYMELRQYRLAGDYRSHGTNSDKHTPDPNQGLHQLKKEWSEYVLRVEVGGDQTPRSKEQEILARGFADFRRMHEEYQQLLQDRAFTIKLASAIARMRNARSLIFFGEWRMVSLSRFGPDFRWAHDNDAGMLSRYMANPIMSRDCEFETACAELQVFSFRIPPWGSFFTRHHTFAAAGKPHIDSFFGKILSRCGPHLRVFDLDCYRLLIDTPDISLENRFFHADYIITTLGKLPRIRVLNLVDMDLQKDTLEALCSGLGEDIMSIEIDRVRLHNGNWADTMDILREKTGASGARRSRHWNGKVAFWRLRGAEFDHPRDDEWSKSALEEETEKYVKGILEWNPLRIAAQELDKVNN